MQGNKTYIYTLTDPITNKIRYIGKANNIKARLRGHLSCKAKSRKNNWIKSLKNSGFTPIIEVLDEVSLSEWEFWERHYISLFKSWGFSLTNSTDGGEAGPDNTGYKHTAETIEKFKNKIFTEEHKKNLSISLTGKTISKKTIERLKISHKNQKNENLKKEVFMVDLDGSLIMKHESVSDAARYFNKPSNASANICRAIRNNYRTCYGYKWTYKLDEIVAKGIADLAVKTMTDKNAYLQTQAEFRNGQQQQSAPPQQ